MIWSWYYIKRLHRSDWQTEPIHIVFHIYLSSRYISHSRLEFLILRLLCHIKQSWQLIRASLWHFALLVVRLGMRIIQIDWHNLLWNWLSKGCSVILVILLWVHDVETIHSIIVSWSWCISVFCKLVFWNHRTFLFTDEHTCMTVLIALHRLRVILPYPWCRLLEIDVHSDWFDIVQRILLIKWQTEISLVLHLRPSYVLIWSLGGVMARTDIYIGITLQHICILDKSSLFRSELHVESIAFPVLLFVHLVVGVFFDQFVLILI